MRFLRWLFGHQTCDKKGRRHVWHWSNEATLYCEFCPATWPNPDYRD